MLKQCKKYYGLVETHWYKADYDAEIHQISTPSNYKNNADFIAAIKNAANNFQENNSNTNAIKYHLNPLLSGGANCATGANSLFNAVGVPEKERIQKGEFSGTDWGEEKTLSPSYLRKNKNYKCD